MKSFSIFLLLGCLLLGGLISLSACNSAPESSTAVDKIAPGAPGQASTWAYSGKSGIGTSYEAYANGQYRDSASTSAVSKVWFSLAQGIITETMFGLIHEAQLKEMQFFIRGEDFFHEEKRDTISHIEYLHNDAQGRPLSLAYKIINKDKEGRYEIEKHIFTDPTRNSLMVKVFFRAHSDKITPYLYVNPHIANTGSNDKAWLDNNFWYAQDGDTSMTLATDAQVNQSSVGFVGVS